MVDENVALTRGYNMAFGVMSKPMYSNDIFDALLRNCLPKGKESDDAETRKFAVSSLISAIKTCGAHNLRIEVLKDTLETLYRGLNDY